MRGERSVNRSKSEESKESEEAKKDKKKEAARLKKQRQRAKSSDEQKLAVREASKIQMRIRREGQTQEEGADSLQVGRHNYVISSWFAVNKERV